MKPHLFVYGTLMSTATSALGRDMRARLEREARRMGPAVIHGRLYDLGRYPVLVASDEATDLVHGEIHAMADPDKTLPWLDDYEGIGRRAQTKDEFLRVESLARLDSGTELIAWFYLYQRPVAGLRYIDSGRWQAAG